MALGLLKDMAARAPRGERLLGVDLGTKTIGLAVTDSGWTLATPLKTIARRRFLKDVEALVAVMREYEIGGLVFGWPLNMDGTAGGSCDRVRSFIDEMTKYPQDAGIKPWTELWIALQDERLSTHAVHDFLNKDVDMSRTKRDQVVDKLAAQIILQGALDYMSQK